MQTNYGQSHNQLGNNPYGNQGGYNQPGYNTNQVFNNPGYNPQGYPNNTYGQNYGPGYGQGYPNQGGYNNSTILIIKIQTIHQLTMGKPTTQILCIILSLHQTRYQTRCTILGHFNKATIPIVDENFFDNDNCSQLSFIFYYML